jgi:hypothetical protein
VGSIYICLFSGAALPELRQQHESFKSSSCSLPAILRHHLSSALLTLSLSVIRTVQAVYGAIPAAMSHMANNTGWPSLTSPSQSGHQSATMAFTFASHKWFCARLLATVFVPRASLVSKVRNKLRSYTGRQHGRRRRQCLLRHHSRCCWHRHQSLASLTRSLCPP